MTLRCFASTEAPAAWVFCKMTTKHVVVAFAWCKEVAAWNDGKHKWLLFAVGT